MSATSTYDDWIGRDAVDCDGDKVGEITDIFYDDVTGRPEWVVAGDHIVPIAGATIRRHTDDADRYEMQFGYDNDLIDDAPDLDDFDDDVDRDDDERTHLTAEQERTLYSHYGFNYDERTGEATYGDNYGKLRPDVDYPAVRTQRTAERTETVEVPVEAEVTVPVKSTVRLRRYQTQAQRTETRQVQVPVTETEEHVEVVDVDAETGEPRNA